MEFLILAGQIDSESRVSRNLNISNRRMRTRLSGGVAGEESQLLLMPMIGLDNEKAIGWMRAGRALDWPLIRQEPCYESFADRLSSSFG